MFHWICLIKQGSIYVWRAMLLPANGFGFEEKIYQSVCWLGACMANGKQIFL
jgi:hypothetical protein